MIGTGLKKMARENGMQTGHGVAYGSLRGFGATLSEGAGWKQIVFSTSISDAANRAYFMDAVNSVDVDKLYRVQKLGISTKFIQVTFLDNPGTMKKMYEFLDWFIPLLETYGAARADVCCECGFPVTSGTWALVNGNACCFHDSCARKVKQELEAENQTRREESTGSYLTGALGAFGGALLGSVVWALVLVMGYVASIVGLLIGWLAQKGYDLLHGRQGKAKVLILILAIIFGVVAGTLASDVIFLVQMISDGELPGFVMTDIPFLMAAVMTDGEYLLATGGNVLLGLLFAALGVFSMLRKTGKDVADAEYVELK